MDYQQHSQRFPRPSADPHHQPPMRPPGAPPGPWYPGQFQYQAPPQHSPPPPPPPHSHWPPPSHSDHLPPPPYGAPPPPHPNYPGQHQPFHNQYAPPPPRPHVPPQYHPQAPQSYHQDLSNANWGYQHGQDYPGTASAVKEEDWAAKARAWAATNTGIDAQQSQVQYTSVNRLEEHSHFREQYPQAVDPHYPDALHSAFPPPGYQQSPVPAVPPYMSANILQQESGSMGSGKTSFIADEQYPYKSRDGDFAGGSTTGFSHPGSSPIMSSAHLQEVSSSYSSVTGKVETGDPAEKVYKSFPLSIDPRRGLHQMHLPLPDYHRSFSVDRSHYTVNNQAAERSADLSDQPLDFAPRFHDQDPVTQSSHIRTETMGTISGLDPGAAPTHSWNPAVPGAGYPHIPQAVQSNQQFDPSAGMHSPVPGHSAPLFGRMPGPMFQPTIPSGGAPYGIGAGSGLNLASFPADVYGISGASERPKKASVPNWLKEEIIKNKAVITSSVPDRKEETESFDDFENNDKTTANADQADSKSLDSSRATEEEDDDEDYVEVARTAAINQEIKRILTEVLSKVTDELFDEIATKVLSENDQQSAGVTQDVVPSRKLSPSASAAQSAKPSSAKVQVPGKAKAGENQNDSGKSTSSPPGNVLRLVNYGSDGSDDDSDNDGDSDTANQLPKTRNFSNSKDKDLVKDAGKILPNGLAIHHSGVATELNGYRAGGRSSDVNVESIYSSKAVSGNIENKDTINGRNILKSADSYKHNHDWKVDTTITEALESGNTKKSGKVDSRDEETKSKHDKKDKHDTRSPSRKDTVKEENGNDQKGKRDEKRKDHEERQARKERMDDRNGSNEKRIEHGDKSGEKGKESDSRKRSSHSDVKESVKVKERDRRDNGSRREERHKDEKTERSRPKLASESSKHKRRRSSSVSRGRSSRDDSVNIHANGSSDHSSDDSKRKQHAKRRYSSPSPSRSRKRQDSRSPHSKRSQLRHSPYSSLETSRGRRSRSRSRSPARRRR